MDPHKCELLNPDPGVIIAGNKKNEPKKYLEKITVGLSLDI